jgi:hypothetical protein
MAEWLPPQVFIAEIGLKILRISVGSQFCSLRKFTGWAVSDNKQVQKTPSRHCQEWIKYKPDKRGIEVVSLKEVHRLGGW